MPRQACVNAPGLLYHVMAQGIERWAIFLKAEDYEDFNCAFGIRVVPGAWSGVGVGIDAEPLSPFGSGGGK